MFQIVKEFKDFSRQNWWIYLLLTGALIIVWYTGKGDMVEIVGLFLANILGNLFIMAMQDNYTSKKNTLGAIYHVSSTITFTCISIYGLVYLGQSQYIIWQVAYILAALNAFMFYNYNKEIKVLNEYSFIALNVVLFAIFLQFFEYQGFSILQACGFSLITTGLVSTNDTTRYWLSLIGIAALTSGSAWGTSLSYLSGNLDGIALGFFILTLTVFVYYIKLIKNYIFVGSGNT